MLEADCRSQAQFHKNSSSRCPDGGSVKQRAAERLTELQAEDRARNICMSSGATTGADLLTGSYAARDEDELLQEIWGNAAPREAVIMRNNWGKKTAVAAGTVMYIVQNQNHRGKNIQVT